MKIHDYSQLLTEIDNLNSEEQKIKDERIEDAQERLHELETKLINSGMLRDWLQLREACDKLGIKKFLSFEENQAICIRQRYVEDTFLVNEFERKLQRVESMGFDGPMGKYLKTGSCSILADSCTEVKYKMGEHYMFWTKELEIETKINLINAFMVAYPKYKELKLSQINREMNKKSVEIEKHAMQTNERCNDVKETHSEHNEKGIEPEPEQVVTVDIAANKTTETKQGEEVVGTVKTKKKKDKWWDLPVLILLIAIFGLPTICVFILDPLFGREHGAKIMSAWGILWLIITQGNALFMTIGGIVFFGLAILSYLIADTDAINDKIRRDGSVFK